MSSSLLVACFILIIILALSQAREIASMTPDQKWPLHQVKEKILHSGHHMNARCSRCPPGWGVSQRCSPKTDTMCELCAPGTYSPHYSSVAKCWLCSRCGDELYEAHPCTRRADTICDRCSTLRGPHNGDYSRHCNITSDISQFTTNSVTMTEASIAASHRAVPPALAAEEGSPITSEQLQPLVSLASPSQAAIDAVYLEKQSHLTSERPAVADTVLEDSQHHIAWSAAAIITLQTALLVLAVSGLCLLTRSLRTSTCLRGNMDLVDNEKNLQEETLLQDLKPRDYPDDP